MVVFEREIVGIQKREGDVKRRGGLKFSETMDINYSLKIATQVNIVFKFFDLMHFE